uniref:Uncharacterized protein n=1 Tax=Anguilla anguilla TaxID=7936 RepID=A0A0E9R068_ANGAN
MTNSHNYAFLSSHVEL